MPPPSEAIRLLPVLHSYPRKFKLDSKEQVSYYRSNAEETGNHPPQRKNARICQEMSGQIAPPVLSVPSVVNPPSYVRSVRICQEMSGQIAPPVLSVPSVVNPPSYVRSARICQEMSGQIAPPVLSVPSVVNPLTPDLRGPARHLTPDRRGPAVTVDTPFTDS